LKLLGINDVALQVDPLILKIDDKIKAASLKAANEISTLNEQELHENFTSYINRLNGLTDEVRIHKEAKRVKNGLDTPSELPSHEVTKTFIKYSDTLDELSEKRGVTVGTVIKHLSQLMKEDKDIGLEKFKPNDKVYKRIADCVAELQKLNDKDHLSEAGTLKMKPIFEALNEEVSYDEIRTSMLFL
jgi:hypothetical protein